jgi:hypothetical protein
MGRRFGTWNSRTLYGPGSLKTVATELVQYKLILWKYLYWSDETKVALNLQMYSSRENGKADHQYGEPYLFIR